MKTTKRPTTAMAPPNPVSERPPGGMMCLRYLGQGPRTIHTPIPHVAKCEIEATYVFSPDAEIPAEWGDLLVEMAPDLWVRLDADGEPVRPVRAPAPVDRQIEPEQRARKYVNRGLALMARNRHFVGCTVVPTGDGMFEIVDAPKPQRAREIEEMEDEADERARMDAVEADPGA